MKRMLVLTLAAALAVGAPVGGVALATGEAEIEMEDFAFRPARKVVRGGQLVKWKNSDRARHNATSVARRPSGARLFRTRTVGKDGRVTIRAPRVRGTYRYFCTVHPAMRGTLVVR